MGETSSSLMDHWFPHLTDINGFPGDLFFFKPRAEEFTTRTHALGLLIDCVPSLDASWLDALRIFTAFKMRAHLITNLMTTWVLIIHLVKCVHEEEDCAGALQYNLDNALTQVEELEEELKALHLSKDMAVARSRRDAYMELKGLYRARLERVCQASYNPGYNKARGTACSIWRVFPSDQRDGPST